MAFCNLNYQLLIYKDIPSNGKPSFRIPDITDTMNQVAMNNVKFDDPTLAPGETRTIAVTTRTIPIDNTTEFSLVRIISTQDIVRLVWTGTGTNPAFRAKRNLATDATTQISTARQGPNIIRFLSTGGTPLDSTAVQVGDILQLGKPTDTFQSPFGAQNWGAEYQIQAKGTNYVDVIDNGNAGLDLGIVLGADFDQAFRIISQGPILKGDKVHIDGSNINANNIKDFEITGISSDYVEFLNPFESDQTFVNTSNLIKLYDYLVEFVYVQATGPVTLLLNQVNQEDLVPLGNGKCLKMGTTKAWQIQAVNKNDYPIEVTIVSAGLR